MSLRLRENGKINVLPFDSELLSGTVKINLEATKEKSTDRLYSSQKPTLTPCTAHAIPYYLWANRGENQMRVWVGIK